LIGFVLTGTVNIYHPFTNQLRGISMGEFSDMADRAARAAVREGPPKPTDNGGFSLELALPTTWKRPDTSRDDLDEALRLKEAKERSRVAERFKELQSQHVTGENARRFAEMAARAQKAAGGQDHQPSGPSKGPDFSM
jgi:hypothetical protein